MGNKKLQQIYRAQFQIPVTTLGTVEGWIKSGRRAEARAWLQDRTSKAPTDSVAWELLGDLLSLELNQADAVESYAKALLQKPGNLPILRKIARELLESAQLPEAIQVLQTITLLDPKDAEGQLWLAKAYFRIGPAEGEAEVKRALELDPKSVDGWKIYAQILDKNLRVDESREALDRAIALAPERTDLRTLQLRMLQNSGSTAETQAIFEALPPRLKADGCLRIVNAMIHPMIPTDVAEILTSREKQKVLLEGIEADRPKLIEPDLAIGMTNFKLTYDGLPELELMERTTRAMLACEPTLAYVSPHVSCARQVANRIRVGFISANLAEHSLGRVLNRFMKALDRSRFEVFYIDLNERFISEERRIEHFSDHTLRTSRNLPEARQQISDLKLDVAFFSELILNPFSDLLGYSRFAPVQCMTWGHPATSGRPSIDYWISSESWDPPGNERFYSERLIRLGNLPLISDRPKFERSEVTRAELGIPDGRIYACPQSLFKLHPDFDSIFAKILDQDSESHILLSAGLEPRWVEQLLRRLQGQLGKSVERVLFVPHVKSDAFGVLLQNADVLLDPIHFGGGLSSLDALSLGRPIITWPIDQLRSRMTAGFYEQMGYTDLIAKGEDDYVAKAVALANDPEAGALATERILSSVGVLFDNPTPCRQLEQFFEAAVAGDVGDGYFL